MKKTILSLSVIAAFGIGMVSCGGSGTKQMNDDIENTQEDEDSNKDENEPQSETSDNESSDNEGDNDGDNSTDVIDIIDNITSANEPLTTTLEEYGVTYECKYDPADNDEYIANYDNDAVMADVDEIIKAYEIMEEENLRYIFAPGDSGIDNPAAFDRNQKFKNVLSPYDNNNNPHYFVNSNKYTQGAFTPEQKEEIKSFDAAVKEAENAHRDAKRNQ